MNNSIILDLEPSYFIFVCTIRCTIAAIFKDVILTLAYQKLRKFKKAKQNFKSYALPSIIVYLLYSHNSQSLSFLHIIATPFCILLVALRGEKAYDKVMEKKAKKAIKKAKKANKKLNK